MSPNYLYFAAWVMLVGNIIMMLAVPFMFGEEREPYNPQGWAINVIFTVLIELPVILYIIKHI